MDLRQRDSRSPRTTREARAQKAVQHAVAPILERLENRQLLAAGDLDLTFGNGGIVLTTSEGPGHSVLNDSAVLPDGKVIAVGMTGDDFVVARYGLDGKLDPAFGQGGHLRTDFGHKESANAVVVQSDDKIVVAGGYEGLYPDRKIALARYNPDGSLDTSFGTGGKLLTPSGYAAADVAITPGGKIVVSGSVHRAQGDTGPSHLYVWQYNSDGSPDTSFDGDGQTRATLGGFHGGDHVSAQLAVQPDGKLFALGWAWDTNNAYKVIVARFNADGSIDATFAGGGILNSDLDAKPLNQTTIAAAPDGKFVIAGIGNGVSVARYNGDGSPDTTFDGDGNVQWSEGGSWFLNAFIALSVRSDGKVLIGVAAGENRDVTVARLNADGSFDTTFGVGGKSTFSATTDNYVAEIPRAIGFHPNDGSVIVGSTVGTFNSSGPNYGEFSIVRLDSSGTRDSGYGGLSDLPGPVHDYGRLIAFQPDGKVLAAGIADRGVNTNRSWIIARHLSDGALDATFGTRGVMRIDLPNSDVTIGALRVLADGKIVAAGTMRYFNNELVVARINPDGTLDGTFSADGLMTTDLVGGAVLDALPQPGGGLAVVGQLYDAARRIHLAAVRLTPDGTLDGTFGGGVGPVGGIPLDLPQNVWLGTSAVQPDGKIILAGTNTVLRFNLDWTRDTTFNHTGYLSGVGTPGFSFGDVEFDSAGRLVLLESGFVNNDYRYAMRRLNPDGSADASFTAAGVPLDVTPIMEQWTDLALDAQDRIVLVGNLMDEYNQTRIITMRRNPDGTPDPRFGDVGFVTALPWSNYEISTGAVAVTNPADGKILVFGQTYNPANGTRDLALIRYVGSTPLAAHPGGTYEVIEGGSVTLRGSATSDLPVTKYEWDLNNDGTFETPGDSATFSAAEIDGPAQRIVAFRVSDSSGQTHVRHATININNAPPVITLSGPARADAGVPYPLTWTYWDPAIAAGLTETIRSITIDWGDGNIETIPNATPGTVTHTYSADRALHHVTLTLRDEDDAYVAEHPISGPGLLDPTFGYDRNGIAPARTAGGRIFPLPDGTFIHAAGQTLTRFLADGSLDRRFGGGALPEQLAAADYAITPEGKVLVVGTEFALSGPSARGRIFVARFTITGQLDASFGGDGIVHFDLSGMGLDLGTAVVALPDGRFLLAGATTIDPDSPFGTRTVLLRLNPDGTPDASYGGGGVVVTNFTLVPRQAAVAPSGRIYLGYKTGTFVPLTIAAFNPDGSHDTSFGNAGTIVGDYADAATFSIDPAGNILSTGSWTLTRFRPDGTRDPAFGVNGSLTVELDKHWPTYSDIALDANGGILLLGTAQKQSDIVNYVNGDLVVTRILPDGKLDLAFGDAGSVVFDVLGNDSNDTAHSFVLLPSGKLLVSASNNAAHLSHEPPPATHHLLRLGDSRHPVSANNTGPSIRVDDLIISPAVPREGETFTMSGTITDPDANDSHTVTIEWDWIEPSYVPQPIVLHLPPGQLTFQITHTLPDDSPFGAAAHAWPFKITVSDGLLDAVVRSTVTVQNAAPTASAGLDKSAKENDLVQLTGSATDPGAWDVSSIQYRWKVTGPSLGVGGTQLEFSTKDISFTPGQVGTYTATLTVTDPDGGAHSDSTTITVTDSVPEIRLSYDQSFDEGETVQVNSWYNADIVSRSWTVTDAAGNVVHSSTSGSITFTPVDDGAYTVRVDYADDEGNSASKSVVLDVRNVAPDVPLVFPIGFSEATPIVLSTRASDPGRADVLTYLWEILDASNAVVATSTEHRFEGRLDGGAYTMRVTVSDDDGGVTTKQGAFAVAEVAPKLGMSGPASVPEGSPYTLTLSATDPGDDTITEWIIDWGDGTIDMIDGNPSSVTHTYADGPSTYPIVATATDEDGSYTVRTLASTNPLDTTFGNGGIASTQMNGAHDRVTGLVVQADGKVIAVGSAGNPIKTGVVRYNQNGTRDTSFFTAGTLANTFGDASVAVLPDGTVVVVATSSNGGVSVVRLNPNTGSILTRTEIPTGQSGALVYLGQIQIHTLPDGRFYVAGRGGGQYTVARMTGAGAFDTTFGVRHTALSDSNHQLSDLIVQPDGKVVLGGSRQLANGYGAVLVRHNTDGTLDNTFGGGDGIVTLAEGFSVDAMLPMPDGRILVADGGRLAIFNADGSQDLTFGTNGFRTIPGPGYAISSMLRDAEGRYVLVTIEHEVIRLNPDFTLDTSFGTNGRASVHPGGSYNQTMTAAFTPAGDVVIGGTAGTANVDTNFWVARFLMGQPPVTVTNVEPSVTLSGNPTVADGAPYTLNLAASDPGADTITAWHIDWGDGSPVQTISGNPSSVTHTFADGPGQYMISARVTDEDGTHPLGDTHNVYVTPPTQPFVFGDADVSLSAASIYEGGIVHLSGSFSDTRGVHDVTIDWGDGSAPSTLTLPRGTKTFSLPHQYLDDPAGDADQYVITAVVHNGLESHTAATRVTVNNVAPTADAGPDRMVDEGTPVTVTADATDLSALDVLTYHWEVITDTGLTFPVGKQKDYSFTPPDAGTYELRLTVRDDDGGVRTDSMTVTATEVLPTLHVQASAPSITEGGTLTLTLAASDPGANDTITHWMIDWGDGSPPQTLPGDATSASHRFTDGPLDPIIVVRAGDANGAQQMTIVPGLVQGGANDLSFGVTGKVRMEIPGFAHNRADDVRLLPDGKALVVAALRLASETADRLALIRYNPDGSLDNSFGDGGVRIIDAPLATRAFALDVFPSGKIIVLATGPLPRLWRFNPDGSPDLSFGTGGSGRLDLPNVAMEGKAIRALPDGRILIGGNSFTPGGWEMLAIMRLNEDGTLDSTFGGGGRSFVRVGGMRELGTGLAIGPDGKIVLIGEMLDRSGSIDWGMARFNADGTLDTTFSEDGVELLALSVFNDRPVAVAYQPDGRIIIAGTHAVATAYGDIERLLVRRFDNNGAPDRAFGVDGSALVPQNHGFRPTSLYIDDTGRAHVGGNSGVFSMMRLTPDGQFDTTFGGGDFGIERDRFAQGSIEDRISKIAVDGLGRIWAVGVTRPASGLGAIAVARYVPGGVRVTNASPVVSIPTGAPGAGSLITIGMNMPLTRAGFFTDPGDDTWTATVNYGDGAPVETLTLNADKTFNLNHTYTRAGRYTITVTVTDSDGAKGSRSIPVHVRDARFFGTQLADTLDVRLTPDGQYIEFFENAPLTGAPTFVLPVADATTLTISRGFGNDRITIHSGTFNVRMVEPSGYTLLNHELVLKNDAAVTIVGNNEFRAIEINDASRLSLEPGGKNLRTSKLTINGTNARLDLVDGTLRVPATSHTVAAIEALLRSARNTGTSGPWTGPGITSSRAAANPRYGLSVSPLVASADLAVRYMLNGDVNHDDQVNADDYFRIDNGFLDQPQGPTYAQGDFNYDGIINADDYFLIDSAFLSQAAPLAGAAPTASTATAGAATASVPMESRQKVRKRLVRPIFSDQPVAARRAAVARRR